jgi:serine protease inhibitor
MHNTKLFALCLLFTVFVLSLESSNDKPSAATIRISQANTHFAFKMLQQIGKTGAASNFFFSPASIEWCLGMALNGAGGATRDEMNAALETRGIQLNDFNHAIADWEKSWTSIDPKVQLEIANSVWARKGITLQPDYLGSIKDYFDAQASSLDFNDPRSIGLINGWVQNKTHNKINKIVDQINSDSVLFLLNAIYFNGKWTNAFDAAKTKQETFTTITGAANQVQMMRQRGTFEYFENEDFQAIRLPYGNRRFTMDVFLPSTKMQGSSFLNLAQIQNWNAWVSQFSEADGEIALPRFRVEFETSLNSALKALGMKAAFDPNQADFSNMVQNSPQTFISDVKHKAFAEVTEEGTEAAAVTSTEVRAVSMIIPSKPFTMVVNRPFFFVIEDTVTHSLLFVGWIVSPA